MKNRLTIGDNQTVACFICGERGIRTPGGVTLNGFQDRRNRPLCHLSKIVVLHCKVTHFFAYSYNLPEFFSSTRHGSFI